MRERYEFYAFSDHSDDPYEEYTIKDGELVSLFELCAKYSKIVALSFLPGDEKILARLSTYALDESETGIFQKQQRIVGEIYIDGTRLTEKYYHVGPGFLQTLLEISEYDLFTLAHFGNSKPENPAFYRADGSIFFDSIIHDGKCYLFPRAGEDVSAVVSHPGWRFSSRR